MRWTSPLSVVFVTTLLTAAGCARPSKPAEPTGQNEPAAVAANENAVPVLPHPVLATFGPTGSATVADIAERVTPSVVSVHSTKVTTGPQLPPGHPFRHFFGPMPDQRQQGLGSGVIVAKDLVVTNNHVVEDADEIKITTKDDLELEVELVGTDPKTDLAVLRITAGGEGLRPLPLGDSSKLRLGDAVLAIGNPFGIGQTVTMGIVSAKGRADLGIVDYEDFIQTDAAINPGNSGGALVNMQGELIGINTAIVSRSGGYQGIGFAIPTDMARPIVESLVADGHVERGWLGVHIQDLSADLAEAMGLKSTTGVLIADVGDGTPAQKAGVKRGDVVLEVDGKAVTTTGQLRNQIAAAGAQKRVELTLLRDGKKRKLPVALGAMPDDPAAPGKSSPGTTQSGPLDGLALQELTPELRNRLRLDSQVTDGVVVAGVEPGSPAARAGLRPGDVILEVDRQPVTSVKRFGQLWRDVKGKALLLVHRQGATNYIAVGR